jgi:tRNA (Thr-GGU) A37 N-methylase
VLTFIELLKVESGVLYVKGLDAINGTPALDIKPYIKKTEENSEESKLNKNIQTEKTTINCKQGGEMKRKVKIPSPI